MQPDYARQYRTLWERHWWWRSREAFLLDQVGRLHRTSPCRRILDVGCGDGLFFEALGRFGHVEGLEPDASLVDDPRWRSQIRVGTLGSGLEGERDYDLLLLLDVLEHIEDDASALHAARSALRDGGTLLMTVPALPGLWSRHDEANQHYRRYRREGLRDLLESVGFEVESVRYFFFWAVLPLVLRRWLSPAGPGASDYDVQVPCRAINGLLDRLSRLDHAIGRRIPWPLGSSLVAVARRPSPNLHGRRTLHSVFRGGRLPSGVCAGE